MSFKDRFGGDQAGLGERTKRDVPDQELEQALRSFRASVFAWSAAAYSRPRRVPEAATQHRKGWRLAAGWALGFVLVTGGVSGGFYEHHHRQEMARVAAAREAEQQRLIAEQNAREEEELLAKVDSEVSQEVPSAMEPLAQLMAEDEGK